MITCVVLIVLAALSAYLRQFVNRAALIVLDAIGLGCVFVSAARLTN